MPDANLDSLTRADVDGLNLFRASAGIEPLMLIDAMANRPAAGTVNRFFYATDEQRLYRDTGSAWEDLQIPESALIDGGIVARLAAAETVSGDWTFSGDQDFTGAVQFSGQNVYTPESQGAVDGTDDDVQIQAAIDAAEAAGGGIVLLRPVTYVIGTTLTVGDNVTLLGSGMFSTSGGGERR